MRAVAAPAASRELGARGPTARLGVSGPSAATRPVDSPPSLAVPGLADWEAVARAQVQAPCRGLASSPPLGGQLPLGVACCASLALLVQTRRRSVRGRCRRSGRLRRGAKEDDELPSCVAQTVGKGELKRIISKSIREKGTDATVRLLDNIKELGFGWATKAGISLGVEDLCVPESKAPICEGARQRTIEAELAYANGDITVVEKFLKVTGEWKKASEAVKDAAMENFKENMPTNPVYMMSTSGARGSISQVRQLIAMRGLMADANGEIIEVPISNSLRDGMTVTDMLISGHGARKGVIDTALRTADSGYLYRRLDFAASQVVIRAEDCGTELAIEHGLDCIFKPAADLAARIRGRILASDVLDPDSHKVMFQRGHLLTLADSAKINQRWKDCEKAGITELLPIRVRSSLTCNLQDGLCSKCYGEDLSTPDRLVKIGTPVGTIAAQSMGEPGTQLTMRTFHTGGAFEGGAGEGVFAAFAGTVRLTAEGKPIVKPGDERADATAEAGRWLRTPPGDVACLLSCQALLEVAGRDGSVQKEVLEPDTLVKVHDGQVVSRGQNLFETDARQMVEALEAQEDNVDIDKLPKPIIAQESGEVVITDASTPANCLKEGSKLVWVLQGSCTSFENEARCSFAVRKGDIVAAGMPLATEWALTRRAGVQRFQLAGAGRAAGAGAGAAGWRHLDWRREARAEDPEPEPEEDALDQGELCLRTDFDWFKLPGAVAEYRASSALPAALMCQESTLAKWAANRVLRWEASQAAKEAIKALQDVKPTIVSVYAYSPRAADGEAEEHEKGLCSQGVVCTVASRSTEGALCPVSRIAHPQHTVPVGGLVFHLPSSASKQGGRALLWVPEESQMVQINDDHLELLLQDCYGERASSRELSRRTMPVNLRMDGCFCVYLPGSRRGFQRTGAPLAVVPEDESGVLRREGRERLCPPRRRSEADEADQQQPEPPSTSALDVECVAKPGHVFACNSERLDESWYDEDPAGRGLFFHQKVIPPGVPFIRDLPNMISEHWRVVEILDDPRAGPLCRVLVRVAKLLELPRDPEPERPAETRSLHSWHLPYGHGELVRSGKPLALAHEVISSVSRHPGERHGATPVPVESTQTLTQPAGLPKRQVATTSEVSGLSLELVRESPASDICVVQHSPIGTPQPVSGGGNWSEPLPKYMAPDQDERVSAAATPMLPTPRRQLVSEGGGCVCSVGDTAGGRSTVVLLGPGDCARVACRGRPTAAVGALLRRGEALSKDKEDMAPFAGQVLLVEEAERGEDGAAFQVTLRRARPYLVTPGGEVRVRNGSVVQQGDLLGTENLVVPRTSDITQGLPRITRLFEASGGTQQDRLDELWEEARPRLGDWEAAKAARRRLQEEMVSEIQSVYGEQGVYIDARHIEIVVAQMTQRCEVLTASGKDLQKGSLVTYSEIEALLALGPSTEIKVRPCVKGVTAVGKDTHVMVSMGFREIDNCITQAVMCGPERYPLRGIKENLMMGKAINVGSQASASRLWNNSHDHSDAVADPADADIDLLEIPDECDGELLGDLVGNM